MRFHSPGWLIILLPAAAAIAHSWLRLEKRRAAMLYPGSATLADLTPKIGVFWVRRLPAILKSAALILAIAALARPQTVLRHSAGLTEGIDILLVMDTSMSMLAEDFAPHNRIDAAVEAARDFIRRRTSDRIGLLVFGSAPLLSSPLTLDHAALLEFLDDVQPGMVDQKGTAIGDGIASGVNHLKETESKSKVMILLTDGSSNTGLLDPVTAAQLAQTFGIKVYTIGTGKRGVAYATINHPVYGTQRFIINDDLDEDTLLKVAAETDGKYYRATNTTQLKEIYEEINRLEKHRFEKPEFLSYHDHYIILLIPAALLLASGLILSRTLLLRIP
ncbi:MAG: VWA domain-containing protein [Elusimicrobiota bacterium]